MTGLTRRAATLAARVEVRGVGLHSGRQARVRLTPAPAADGITFVRRDLGGARIRASPLHVVSTARSTTLGESSTGGASVATVEHLMAALSGAGVSACTVDVDAPELPVLDGSAAPWLDAINTVGLAPLDDEPAVAVSLSRPLAAPDETSDGWAIAMPAPAPRLTVGIDFSSHEPIGRQWFTWTPDPETFGAEVAPARTFAVEEHLAPMRAAGLLRGGSLKHGLLCSKRRWINGPLRFPDEPCRHKLLDLLGDLALLGPLPLAHVIAYKASHRLHVRLAAAMLAQDGAGHVDVAGHVPTLPHRHPQTNAQI